MDNNYNDENKKLTTPDNVRKRNLRPPPLNPLEINQSLIEPRVGRDRIGLELDKTFNTRKIVYDGDNYLVRDANAWEQLTTITSDVRLSNLSYSKEHAVQELKLARFWLKMSQLTLQDELYESSLLCHSILSTITETSQAKNGFLRNNLQTIRQESQHIQIEDTPKKRSLLGSFFKSDNAQR